MFELKNLTKVYAKGTEAEVKALDDIQLSIEQGDFIAVQGPSGCGKTSLLNILGLLDSPTTGEYLIDGEDVSSFSDSQQAIQRNQHIGFVLQDFALINSETALYNVGLPMYLDGQPRRKIRERVENAMDLLGVADQVNKKVRNMSGGQRQRVAIARALINEPKLILADEPTGSLDQATSHQVVQLLAELHEKMSVTVLMVTHDKTMTQYAKRTIHMVDGRFTKLDNHPV